MGQYYYPINVDKMQYVYSHDFDNGLKLMEHSYIGNDLMNAVEALLTPLGSWHKCRLVWAGDYADGEGDVGTGLEEESTPNLHSLVDEKVAPYEILSELVEKKGVKVDEYPYIVNHTKKIYIDKRNVLKFEAYKDDEGNPVMIQIHPLSLLTAEGNGRGGGDYGDNNPEYDSVGSWARDSISIEKEVPDGYKEETYNFAE